MKAKGAFVSESALHIDGGKPNSVGVITHADDHLSHSATLRHSNK